MLIKIGKMVKKNLKFVVGKIKGNPYEESRFIICVEKEGME